MRRFLAWLLGSILVLAGSTACSSSTDPVHPNPTGTSLSLGIESSPIPTRTPAPTATASPLPSATRSPDILSGCAIADHNSAPGVVTLNAVGDVMLARDLVTLMDEHGPLYPFELVCSLLADADLTIANLEGTFTERGVAAEKFYTFRTPPGHAFGLLQAGIDLVSLGNNHTMDYGLEGLQDTLLALDTAGLKHSGAGLDEVAARKPVILEANGIRIAFLSFSAILEATFAGPANPGVARAGVEAISQDVAAARSEADIVVVSLHAGIEYTDPPTSEQGALARVAIDAGAILVLGTHPHVLQGWQHYKNGLIVFSLGNFVFDLDSEDLETLGPRPFRTVILQVELTRDGVQSVSATPVYIDPVQNRPQPADPDQTSAIEERLAVLNKAFR